MDTMNKKASLIYQHAHIVPCNLFLMTSMHFLDFMMQVADQGLAVDLSQVLPELISKLPDKDRVNLSSHVAIEYLVQTPLR